MNEVRNKHMRMNILVDGLIDWDSNILVMVLNRIQEPSPCFRFVIKSQYMRVSSVLIRMDFELRSLCLLRP
jgi:hypothetical protein